MTDIKTYLIKYDENDRPYISDNFKVSKEQWIDMFNDNIFTGKAMDMLEKWYNSESHQSTVPAMCVKNGIDIKKQPYNGLLSGMAKKIRKTLDIELIGKNNNEHSNWILLYESWKVNKHWMLKQREELVQAIEELELFSKV